MTATITTHPTASRAEWLAARLELLKAEKELTHRSDEVAQIRQALPWVRVEKDYQFDTDTGPASLADLFRGRSQLLIYHFMFGPDYKAGCPSCSAIADQFDGTMIHLANHDVAFSAVSRAPLARLQAYKERLGWHFPWASSESSDFNRDYAVGFNEAQLREGIEYNYRRGKPMLQRGGDQNVFGTGVDLPTYMREQPGMSAFVLESGVVYHTYSAYARGLDALWGMWQWLDRAPLGRNETGFWWKRHDEYGSR
jgi:predicted dithiol-disulfide oxidoreductase (DUF899 family)